MKTTFKKNGGFTLVELIVVIAILAILAAVAIPAYSGYIEKANKAGDEQLVAAINRAFVSACMENGIDNTDLAKGEVAMPIVNGKINYAGVKPEAIRVSFQNYMAGNTESAFKFFGGVKFVEVVGTFVGSEETLTTVTFGGNSYTLNQDAVDAFKGSVFANDVGAMQGQLSGVSGAFGTFVGDVDGASFSPEFQQYLKDNNIKDEDIGNAAVLYIAGNAADYSANDVAQMFQDAANYMQQTGDPSMRGMLEGAFNDNADPLTSAALMYGAVTAFANSDKCTDPNLKTTVANVSNGADLMNVFMGLNGNSEWSAYLGTADGGQITASPQFTNDMNGFLGAMDAINTVSPELKTDIGNDNLWNTTDVNNLLGSLGIGSN